MEQEKKKKKGLGAVGYLVVMAAVVIWLLSGCQTVAEDVVMGMFYAPSAAAAEMQESLDLTFTGQRILKATRPEVNNRDEFNANCESHDEEIMTLGCYSNGVIYVYDIPNADLDDSEKNTLAHELLHAVWERMGSREKARVKELLQETWDGNAEWFEDELATYDDAAKLEEVYTRAATKLRDLPEELEKHYGKFFNNREQIVKYYENAQAPFEALREENQAIKAEIDKLDAEIETERAEYRAKNDTLNADVTEFNDCARTAGCFASDAVFYYQKSVLDTRRENLEAERTALNEKIEYYNGLIEEHNENADQIGELNNQMNSNSKIE